MHHVGIIRYSMCALVLVQSGLIGSDNDPAYRDDTPSVKCSIACRHGYERRRRSIELRPAYDFATGRHPGISSRSLDTVDGACEVQVIQAMLSSKWLEWSIQPTLHEQCLYQAADVTASTDIFHGQAARCRHAVASYRPQEQWHTCPSGAKSAYRLSFCRYFIIVLPVEVKYDWLARRHCKFTFRKPYAAGLIINNDFFIINLA